MKKSRCVLWAGKYGILVIKASEMHYFSTLFGKELYMFQTDLLSNIRSLNTVLTATGICETGYVDCLLVDSMTNTYCCQYSIKTPDGGQ